MLVLLTILHTFLMELAGKICLNIKTFYCLSGDRLLYFHDLYV